MVSAQLFIHRGVNKGVVVGWPQTRFQPRPISAILGSRCTSLLLRIHNGYQLCSVVICLMFMVILLVLIACIVATRCLLASTSRWPAVLIPQLFAGQKRCVPGISENPQRSCWKTRGRCPWPPVHVVGLVYAVCRGYVLPQLKPTRTIPALQTTRFGLGNVMGIMLPPITA
jgi:hypothetical protein